MDNLTHSLTGVLAGRVLPPHDTGGPPETGRDGPAGAAAGTGLRELKRRRRAIFWTLLAATNFPDIDVLANFFLDPLESLNFHRSYTHSILCAPLSALIPAAIVLLFTRAVRFRVLWLASLAGVLIHIAFDLITPYGTRIFMPASEARYSLDWMFIIDPWFTVTLAALLAAGKWIRGRRRVLGRVAAGFVLIYAGFESGLRWKAMDAFREELQGSGRRVETAAVLPQPFTLFTWVGLATTDSGIVRQYLSLPSGAATPAQIFPRPRHPLIDAALRTSHAIEYLRFARFPSAVVQRDSGTGSEAVEFRDLQFSVDPRIAAAVGVGERDLPFVLRLEFDRSGNLSGARFNDNPVPLER